MSAPNEEIRQIDIVKIYANKKCLVIDDFPEIRGSLSRTLKTFGAQSVDTAADGEEAVKLCQKKKFDIVLCDYNLGSGKDGQQILEEVRFLRVLLMTSLFVMITGESSREMVLGALECQPDDYITKPYTQASIKVRLDKAILKHEALLPIKHFVSKGEYQSALDKCNQLIQEGSRYSADCLRMKGQLHFLLKQLKEAQQIYESILDKKPVTWAKLGMSKTLMEMGKLDSAEDMLNEIIEEDSRYIEAHDMLSEIYSKKNDLISAQKSTENATHISPKSVLRHRKLADLAEKNDDTDTTLKSHQQAIKWGFNSCHESEQDYFNYARKVSEVTDGDQSTNAKAMVKQANTFLDRAKKRYSNRPEVGVQAQLVEAQLLNSQGETNRAEKAASKAKLLYDDLTAPSIDASLELARTMYSLEDEEGARNLLSKLALRHGDDEDLMRIIDGITGEPISEQGKSLAAKLTKSGIDAYENKEFDRAIQVFSEALESYPKHIGLNLNLLQALIADADQNGYKNSFEKLCHKALRAVGTIEQNNKQYKRYSFILNQLQKKHPHILP